MIQDTEPGELQARGSGFRVRAGAVERVLIAAVVAVLVLHVLVQTLVRPGTTGDSLWFRLSAVDGENTLPTWLAAFLLIVAAGLGGLLAQRSRGEGGRWARHWAVLAVLLLVFSIDEVAGFHETLSHPIREALDLGGVWYYAWVIPAAVAVLVAVAVFARFVVNLPPPARWRVIIGGVLFVAGALGMELVGGTFEGDQGAPGYIVASTVEEALEYAGVLLLIGAQLRLMGSRLAVVTS